MVSPTEIPKCQQLQKHACLDEEDCEEVETSVSQRRQAYGAAVVRRASLLSVVP
jgi:hypothetical protein